MLTKDEKILLLIKGLYFFGIAIANTFAQVYLYNYTGSFIQMTLYTISRVCMIFLFFYFSAKLCTKFKVGITMIMGLLSIALSLVWMLYLKEEIGKTLYYVYLIGLLWGAGEGFFWFSCVTLQQYITKTATRAHYFSVSGVISGAAGIAAPLLSALILAASHDVIIGYYRIFQITIVLFLVASILCWIMNTSYQAPSFSLKGIVLWNHDKRWKWMTLSNFMYGIRDAASFSITGLLIYEAAGNSVTYGNMVSAFALLSVIAYALTGRFIPAGKESSILSRSSLTMSLSGFVLVLFPNVFGAALHGILYNMSYAFYENSFNISQMNELSHYIEAGEKSSPRVVVKEGFFDAGRVVGFLFLIALMSVLPKSTALLIAIPLLYSFSMFVALYTNRYEKRKQAMHEKSQIAECAK